MGTWAIWAVGTGGIKQLGHLASGCLERIMGAEVNEYFSKWALQATGALDQMGFGGYDHRVRWAPGQKLAP